MDCMDDERLHYQCGCGCSDATADKGEPMVIMQLQAAPYTKRYDYLDQPLHECRQQQRNSARYLRDVARYLRRKQREVNIDKRDYSAAGILGAGLDIAGILLAPSTGGLSLGLTVTGGILSVLSGGGDFSSTRDEIKINQKAVEEAQEILDQLGRVTTKLLEKLRPELEAMGISWRGFLKLGVKAAATTYDLSDLHDSIRAAMTVASITMRAEKTAAVLVGREFGKTTSWMIARAGFNPETVGKVLAYGVDGVSIIWNLADIIDTNRKIRDNVSEVADKIDEIASALERH